MRRTYDRLWTVQVLVLWHAREHRHTCSTAPPPRPVLVAFLLVSAGTDGAAGGHAADPATRRHAPARARLPDREHDRSLRRLRPRRRRPPAAAAARRRRGGRRLGRPARALADRRPDARRGGRRRPHQARPGDAERAARARRHARRGDRPRRPARSERSGRPADRRHGADGAGCRLPAPGATAVRLPRRRRADEPPPRRAAPPRVDAQPLVPRGLRPRPRRLAHVPRRPHRPPRCRQASAPRSGQCPMPPPSSPRASPSASTRPRRGCAWRCHRPPRHARSPRRSVSSSPARPTPTSTVVVLGGDPDWIARYLASLPFAFEVLGPDEVREEVAALGRRLLEQVRDSRRGTTTRERT